MPQKALLGVMEPLRPIAYDFELWALLLLLNPIRSLLPYIVLPTIQNTAESTCEQVVASHPPLFQITGTTNGMTTYSDFSSFRLRVETRVSYFSLSCSEPRHKI